MEKSVFQYTDYKKYLESRIQAQPKAGYGFRKVLAQAAQCQTGYVSQVLLGDAHFSWEQGVAISKLLEHGKDESRYFLLLIEYTRAGTKALRDFLEEQLTELRERNALIQERVKVHRELSLEHQAVYYSAWYYAAIHVILTIPEFQTRERISEHLGLPKTKVAEVLDFLTSVGLAKKSGSRYQSGLAHIYLSKASPLIPKHHSNWRLQALRSIESGSPESLHFSSVFTLSREDLEKVRAILLKTLETSVDLIKSSKEEKLYCLSADFFEL